MNLTETSYYTRKMAPFAIFAFIVLLIFFYSVKLFFLFIDMNKPVNIFIDPSLGKIKMPVIPSATQTAGFNFTLDTIEGKPVTATATAKVYLLPESKFQLGYIEKIYVIAKAIGFDTETVKHTLDTKKKIAQFNDGRQKLDIDISTFNIRYDYDFNQAPELFDDAIVPDSEESVSRAIDYLKSVDRYPDEMAKGKTSVIFMKYDKATKRITILESNQDANMVEVDLFRPDVSGVPSDYPVVSPTFHNSQNYVTMVMLRSGYKVVGAQVKFFEKSETQVGTYPLITADAAYEKLKAGKAYIVSRTLGKSNIAIKKMFLGYFDPDVYQGYYQPVYVFLGDNNFVGYVPAVADEWLMDYSTL